MTDNIKVNIDEDSCDIVNKVMDYLEKHSQSSTDEVKMYFSGEFDSNQTKFESKSNKLKIGVLANNDIVGKALLRLVRIIIDLNEQLIYCTFSAREETKKTMNIDEFVNKLGKDEEYLTTFKLNETPKLTLCGWEGKIEVTRKIEHIDLWTLPRVKQVIYDIL